MFIDTHCHFTDEAFPPAERDEAIRRALEAGVGIIIQADIDSSQRGEMLALTDRHKGVLFPMAGLYPGSVGEDWKQEVDKVEKVLSTRTDIVAVGEIGLDYHYGRQSAALQKEAFRAQMEIAARFNLPVNIHLREATEDFFDILQGVRGLGLKGNLHAFSGSLETFRRLPEGWMVGIGGVATFKNSGIGKDLKDIPLERIVLETDAPYLAPVPLRGTRNESANIPLIATFIAGVKGVGTDEVERVTSENAGKLFEKILAV